MTQNDILNISYSSLEVARAEMKKMLEERRINYSLPRPLYNDPLLFKIDVEEINPFEALEVKKKYSDDELDDIATCGLVALGLGMRKV